MEDIPSDEEFFTERTEELAPGQEITGNLVFINENFDAVDKVYLTFEELSKHEIKFEIPIPKIKKAVP
ncbi:hypothetical protein RWE15_12735 [Virgibacillus halophilus]|uniref:Uncharacterized protein n=1 Tax=Tigheibacillus halophilus TaxID=361280 RepID=A0ABU5C745_9BACI|nr:hypothetical protein [Virgibacillus halophilus]